MTTSVRVTRLLPALIEEVFEAWRNARAISAWFVVDPTWRAKATNEFRVGGQYRIEMHRSDGTVFVCWGEAAARHRRRARTRSDGRARSRASLAT